MQMTARVTADAKVVTVKDDKKVVNFSVALNDSYKPKGSTEVTKVVTYFDCAYWLNAGIAQYLKKGTIVEMDGRIGVDVYTNMNGEPKASLKFHVNSIKLHGGGRIGIEKPVQAAAVVAPDTTDDLPF